MFYKCDLCAVCSNRCLVFAFLVFITGGGGGGFSGSRWSLLMSALVLTPSLLHLAGMATVCSAVCPVTECACPPECGCELECLMECALCP